MLRLEVWPVTGEKRILQVTFKNHITICHHVLNTCDVKYSILFFQLAALKSYHITKVTFICIIEEKQTEYQVLTKKV